jgi:hypothetical protein
MASEALFVESADSGYNTTKTHMYHGNLWRTMIASLLSLVFLFFGAAQGVAAAQTQKAEAFDVTKLVACAWGSDALPGKAYQWTQSSDAQFNLFSKSAISFGSDEVSGGLNSLFVVTGQDFEHVNEDIRGVDENGKKTHEFNAGRKYNFFERFGVAGIQYSSYLGEWKHVVINACDDDPKPQDPKANHFYDTRLDPESTWDDISSSKDVRTKLFGRGVTDRYISSVSNFIANCFLFVTKLVVALVVAFISFSFQDVGNAFGLPTVIFGADGHTGFFKDVIEGVFYPLLSVSTLLFIISLINAMAHRSGATVWKLILRFFFSFLLLVLFLTFPGVVASAPLNTAVLIQSLALRGVNQTMGTDQGLCATDSSTGKNRVDYTKDSKVTKDKDFGDDWSYVSNFTRDTAASLDCSFVKLFVFEPWVQGQFGTEFNNLWAEEKIPSWAHDGKSIGNANTKQVGDAGVPMGNNEWVTNWALFQVSTQTNAHIPTGAKGEEVSKVSSGVAHDWWRIVDAVSNYTEKDVPAKVELEGDAASASSDNWVEVTRGEPDVTKKPLKMWDTWNGTSPGARLSSSFMSMFVAIGALIIPGILGLIAGALSIALELSVLILPMGFVFAFGNEAMFAWFVGVIGIVGKLWAFRVAAGVSLVFSIISVLFVMNSLAQFGWWQSVLMLILLSAATWVSRERIAATLMAFVSMGQDLTSKPAAMFKQVGGYGKAAAKTVVAGGISGASSKRHGGSFTKGAFTGMKDKARDLSRQTDTGRKAWRVYSSGKRGAEQGVRADKIRLGALDSANIATGVCYSCANPVVLDGSQEVYRDSVGNLYCSTCALDGLLPDDAFEIEDYSAYEETTVVNPVTSGSRLMGKNHVSPLKRLKENNVPDVLTREPKEMTDKQVQQAYVESLALARADVADARERYAPGAPVIVTMPDELKPFVNEDLVVRAWRERNYDYVRLAYIVALKKFIEENTGREVDFSDERSLKFMRHGE